MDEVYRGYRITISETDCWRARITHVRGPLAPFKARADLSEGEGVCAARARDLIDRYVEFLAVGRGGGRDN